MLKGVDPLLSGELLKVLDEMGHGDVLVIADRNFPSYSRGLPVVRVDAGAVEIVKAVLSVFPLDTFVDRPFARMGSDDDPTAENPVQAAALDAAIAAHGGGLTVEAIPRSDFYPRADLGYAVIHTLETAPYCNFLLTKGVVTA
ncbi:MAG: RbsD/FucU domain-containing protein [Pseudolysinimonas sp.]|uniref:RbsD/FucU family protein n=1 Tax=Pseudolysinimonas sp. TaxID=2680009 RepID=UPI003263B5D0